MSKHGSGAKARLSAVPPVFMENTEFRIEVADAIPLPPPNLAQHVLRKPKPIARQRQRDEQQVMHDTLHDPFDCTLPGIKDAAAAGNELLFVRPGIPNATVRKLKRGGWMLRAELDLHGMNGDESRMALAVFLHDCGRRELRCVRIIHGKGLGSRNREPVLKHKVRHWLMQREDVLAFCQARQVDGGAGAVVVLLKSATR